MKTAIEVDLRSDTFTKPTPKMREAMANAEVGDDVYREDPTVLKLEQHAAKFLGKEAALFVPSGTMGNLTAIMSHCWERGCEVYVGDQTHIYLYEQGGAAQLAGVQIKTLKNNPDGTFDLDELKNQVSLQPSIHECKTKLICLENTNNRCGGAVLPTSFVKDVCKFAKANGLMVHMDGARLVNAAIYLGESCADIVSDCDSVNICLSKGLGAPVGTIVAGSNDFIARVIRCRKVLGGAMRQVGVLAAAGLVAFESVMKRLALDHKRAHQLAEAVSSIDSPLVTVIPEQVQTNMVLLYLNTNHLPADKFMEKMKEVSEEQENALGHNIIVKVSKWSATKVRCVLHSDISDEDLAAAIKKLQYVVNRATIY